MNAHTYNIFYEDNFYHYKYTYTIDSLLHVRNTIYILQSIQNYTKYKHTKEIYINFTSYLEQHLALYKTVTGT